MMTFWIRFYPKIFACFKCFIFSASFRHLLSQLELEFSLAGWQVLITSSDKTNTRAYILPTCIRLAEVRQRWETDTGAAPGTQVLRSAAGERLAETLTLEEIGETFPSSQLVKLDAEGGVSVSVRLFEESGAPKTLCIFPSDKPETLFPAVRELFNIPGSRTFRLLAAAQNGGNRALICGMPLAAQAAVSAGAVLFVDLSLQVTAENMWSFERECHLIFASETWSVLLPLPKSHPQRLEWRGRRLNVDCSLAVSLRPSSFLSMTEVDVKLHVAREVTIAAGRRFKNRLVWPTDRVADLPNFPLSLDGVPLAAESTLAEAGLSENAVVCAEDRLMWVLLSDGTCQQIPVSSLDTVGDLHSVISQREGDSDFELKRGSLLLDDHNVMLSDISVSVDTPLQVERRAISLVVEVGGRPVYWSTERRALRFSHIRDKLAASTSVGHRELTEMVLVCAGCGRRMRHTDEHCQQVPVQCCEVQSLHLVAMDTDRHDVAVQCTQVPEGRAPTTDVDDSEDQVLTEDCGVNTESVEIRPEEQCRLYVWVENGSDQTLDVQMPSPISVGDVRRMIASHLEVQPMNVQMERWVGRRTDGCACYQVCNEDDIFIGIVNHLAEFGTRTGEVFNKLEAFNQVLLKQYYDDEEFPMVLGRRSVINAYILSDPMATTRLYINNSEGQDFAISPLLAQPSSVREIRKATAKEMRVDVECIRLERWCAVGPDGSKCVQVCDKNGKFVNINDEEILEFGNDSGAIYRKSAVTGENLALVTDDTTFIQVPNRRCIINLTQRHPRKQQCTLLVVLQSAPNFSFKTIFPEPVTVGEIRKALGDAMKIDANCVKFERWMGTGPRGEPCVQVGNSRGQLVGIASDDSEFGDVNGTIYKKGELIERTITMMCNDTQEFIAVKNRASVVNAYKLDDPCVQFPIHISNRKGPDFCINPLLPQPSTVGDIRSLIAMELKVKPGCVKLKQWTGKSPNDDMCVQVCTPDGRFMTINRPEVEFGTKAGTLHRKRAVRNESLVELKNDDLELFQVPERKLVMNVSQRHPPAKKYPLYLWRESKSDVLFSPFLPKFPTVGDVRAAVAVEVKVPPSKLTMKRWLGIIGGEECAQVCNSNDRFVGIGSDTAEFGKGDGSVHRKDRATRVKKYTLLQDNDAFLIVPGRRSVINVE